MNLTTFARPLLRAARYSTAGNGTVTSRPSFPLIPPKVSGWPTPWLSSKEMEEYLTPLQETAYWEIPDHWTSLSLRRFYWFTNGPSALNFIRDVVDIANAERHHPSMLRYQDMPSPQVEVLINTHSATAFPKLFAEMFPSAFAHKMDPILLPGITMRDVRFATLLHEKFMDTYVAKSKGIDAPLQRPSLKNSRTLIKQAYRRAGLCPACGDRHPLAECEARKQIPPNVLCGACGEPHWHVDCPKKSKSKIAAASPKDRVS
ncbi:hypothetical protein K435DRAFT_848057 [Dendrothele bispora CBS 962.96]|uniref:4a-hydroxytetrahydrobiopterin dehydratase n=1 Tax=Dendrothele bispora (strain CBS 962.96) TaxID=1314807 RepID=A0A4S8MYP0_DENBC|nr:hypothetical protein K435DRAFT_848057 [Dendrothele bispora CBS 962.96]